MEKYSKVMSSDGKLNSRAVHCQSDKHGCLLMDVNVCILVVASAQQRWGQTLMDIEDVAALPPAIVPNDTPKETLGILWRNIAGFFKDPVMKFATGMPTFVHQ